MPIRLGPLELGIILAIVILIFGIGRVGKIGGELGTAIRNFREGLGANKDEDEKKEEEKKNEIS